ncbi:MAG: hypothetical protein FD177_999 [Desulfovibrionaceae bacterium]|nr:MAG: hypothetical protein FD177_999 [Desulfovibrionaceae bacterium]
MSIAAFHTAFQALLTPASEFKTAIGGHFYYDGNVPADLALPYAAWLTVYCEPVGVFAADVSERMVQVDVYAAKMGDAVTLADKALALFDGKEVAGAGLTPWRFQRESVRGPMKDEACWRMSLEFIVTSEDV